MRDQSRQQKVYLVGAGPGDPGLLTLKGLRCLQQADVVFYDFLVNPRLLEHLPPHCRTLYAGKRGTHHTLAQKILVQRIIKEVRRGKRVVRLKGGDPYIFGRGGEEGEDLSRAGVSFEVVPGVTAAVAVPAYAGIPLTHRDYASSVAVITGHERREEGGQSRGLIPNFDWEALSRMDTLVIVMGVKNLEPLMDRLLQAGRSPETPVAIVEWGTLPRQRTIVGTLGTIVVQAKSAGLKPPAVIVVGNVVRLRPMLKWFENKSLSGKTILVTRSREQAGALTQLLEQQGAQVVEIPTLKWRPPARWGLLDRAIRRVQDYQWVVFTSVNAVQSFLLRLKVLKKDARHLKGVKIVAVGSATAESLRGQGLEPDFIPEDYRAEGLLRLFKGLPIKGQKILVPRARRGRELLVAGLRRQGARVELVEAYRMEIPKTGRLALRALLAREAVDLITFASSATVENFIKMVGRGPSGRGRRRTVQKIPAACIGPITAKTARSRGFKVVAVPKKATIPELVQSVVRYFR